MHCGYPKKIQKKPKKVIKPNVARKGEDNTIRNLFSALVILLVVAFIAQAVRNNNTGSSSNTTRTFTTTTTTKTIPRTTPKKKVTKSYPSNAFAPLVDYVRNNMNDPDSFEHVSTTQEQMGNARSISMVYRERNPGGTLVTKKVKAFVSADNIIRGVEYE
ncbi:hypothetical protein UABAM_02720 [Candidatus Uabimicrobium amorphum]|uniref:Uncharacterized protein n=2 Tax=Uabimicrobium amorphum TaxID=2596890 RepID=A0A5S9F3K7_UABAM|nr:hypothetical protein UABAM_02720 [Candidatus Uabimicrobium amorphum]